MIKLSEKHQITTDRNSSKGNQLKWKKDNLWYKADFLGYEALAEYIISCLLEKSNVTSFTKYSLAQIEYRNITYTGCYSEDFLLPNESLITLPRLFQMYLNEDIFMECERLDRTEADCAKYISDSVEKITGLKNFGQHLALMLEIDAFFLNEDRHFHNIAVIYNEETKSFRYCPLFDNGGSLFSDTKIAYPLDKSLEDCRAEITARPFSPCFEDQVQACQELYGCQFKYWFTAQDIDECLKTANKFYDKVIIDRVRLLLSQQLET